MPVFLYTSKWMLKEMHSDSKTTKSETCVCPEVVLLPPRVFWHRERQRLVLISCCGCVLSITRNPPGPAGNAQAGVNPPRFVHWGESTAWSLIPHLHQVLLTLRPDPAFFYPFIVQVPLEAATCIAWKDVRVTPLSCNETLPSSPRILFTTPLPYQPFRVQTA